MGRHRQGRAQVAAVGGDEQEREARAYPAGRASPPVAAEMRERAETGGGRACVRQPAQRHPHQRTSESMGGKGGDNQSDNLPYEPPHVRNDVADTRRRPLYRFQTAGTLTNQEHTGLRRNYQPAERRGGEPRRQGIRLTTTFYIRTRLWQER